MKASICNGTIGGGGYSSTLRASYFKSSIVNYIRDDGFGGEQGIIEIYGNDTA